MARYDYICTACNTIFEVEHPMSEHPGVVCPECGAPAQRHFGTSGIMFKGSGFYNTDQRDKGRPSDIAEAPAPTHTCANCPHKDE